MGTEVTNTRRETKWQQDAPAQANRTNFTAGKATDTIDRATWPIDFRIPVGIPVVDGLGARTVTTVADVERCIVGADDLRTPTVTDTVETTVSSWSITGTNTTQTTDADLLNDRGRIVPRSKGSMGVVGS